MPSESVYLNTEDVKVTSARIIIHETGKTYAMRLVTSVQCIEIPPDNTVAIQCIVWGCVGLLCFGLGVIPLIIGIILLCVNRSRYALAVYTAAGQQQFLVGSDPDEIDRIVRAVNKAIINIG